MKHILLILALLFCTATFAEEPEIISIPESCFPSELFNSTATENGYLPVVIGKDDELKMVIFNNSKLKLYFVAKYGIISNIELACVVAGGQELKILVEKL